MNFLSFLDDLSQTIAPIKAGDNIHVNQFIGFGLIILVGAFITGRQDGAIFSHLTIPEMSWSNGYTILAHWLLTLGEPFAIGLPLLATLLAVVGYFAVRVLWYWMVMREWKLRAARRRITKGRLQT